MDARERAYVPAIRVLLRLREPKTWIDLPGAERRRRLRWQRGRRRRKWSTAS